MIYSFPPIADEHSQVLILGTMPGVRSLEKREYYGHKGNHFWKIMFELFNHPATNEYTTKKQLLIDNHIALWDVLQYCEREGSSDNNIHAEQPNDIEQFYSKYPNVKTVFFASIKAAAYYDKYIGRTKGIQYHTLPSPSGANGWKTFEEKVEEWKLIKKYI